MIEFFKGLMKDKLDNYCMRELTTAICLLLVIASCLVKWIAGIDTPEFMFYSIISLVGAACLGYTIEKTPKP